MYRHGSQDDADLLRDIRTAVAQIKAGKALSNEAAKAVLRRRFEAARTAAAR